MLETFLAPLDRYTLACYLAALSAAHLSSSLVFAHANTIYMTIEENPGSARFGFYTFLGTSVMAWYVSVNHARFLTCM